MKHSCYFFICFGCFMGFTMHFYIIFGTNLLTQSPVPVPVFSLVSVFRRKGISNGVETEWNLLEKLFLEGKLPGRLGVHIKKATRKARGRGRAQGCRHAPYLVASWKLPWHRVQVSWITFVPKIMFPKISFRLDSVWLFLRNSEIGKKTAILGWASG